MTLLDRRQFALTLTPLFALAAEADTNRLVIDPTRVGKPIRMLNGVNGGPLAAGGLLDLSPRWKEAAFPLARVHDSHWPNPDVVDVHTIFPDLRADPSKPESYDFDRTDEYIQAIHRCGSEIVYRLGESIEHQKAKRQAHPPKDFDKWAAVCVGIVRHYTQGWANGFQLPIKYWEIWNEPDNRPNCWTGNDDDYFRLYAITAKALRSQFPRLKMGGPGLGNSGFLKGDKLEPTPFLKEFLVRCKKDRLPLDFLSWHAYSGNAKELAIRAKGIRAILDEAGLKGVESHLNEWNYLPDHSWNGIKSPDASVRERWYARVVGAEGAAFVASTLILLQDVPLDAACYFTAETPGMGLFSPHGSPSLTFAAFRAFQSLRDYQRIPFTSQLPEGAVAMVGLREDKVSVLIAHQGREAFSFPFDISSLPGEGIATYEILLINESNDLNVVRKGQIEGNTLKVDVPATSVSLIRLSKTK
jgi:xylan 1,4-beta-xylosidase